MAKVQLHRAGFEISASDAEIEDLSLQFQKKHAIRLDEFLDPGLLAFVQKAVETADFVPREHGSIKRELCMTRDSLAYHMLMLLANNSQLLAFVQRITGSPTLASYVGRIYRFPPGPEYFDRWHDDLGDGRQVAMSVNLSPEVYEGGLLEIREDGRMLCLLPPACFSFASARVCSTTSLRSRERCPRRLLQGGSSMSLTARFI